MKTQKITITLSEEQITLLDKIMKEDTQFNRSGYISNLIGAEAKRRIKKPIGRPKNAVEDEVEEVEIDYTDDTPKNIPHFGRMIGARELADISERQDSIKNFTQPQ